MGTTPNTELLDSAIREHRAGRFAQAEGIYRRILERDPENADALHLLALIASQGGRHTDAITLAKQAIAITPTADFHNSLGLALEASGQADAAVSVFRQALTVDPDHSGARINLGGILQDRGDLDAAGECYRQVLARAPENARAHNNLGTVQQLRGMLDEAIASYRRALDLNPEYPSAHNNLAAALRHRGWIPEAIVHCERAVALAPSYAKAFANLGIAYELAGRRRDAIGALSRAVALSPGYTEAHNNLGRVLFNNGDLERAAAAFDQAIALNPTFTEALENLAGVHQERGELEQAAALYRRALAAGGDDGIRIKSALLLPSIVEERDAIDKLRARVDRQLAHLAAQQFTIHSPPATNGPFLLAYHGRDDRELLTRLGRILEAKCPSLAYTARHCRVPGPRRARLRVGFISQYLYQHSIGKTTRGLVANLDRNRFEVYAVFAQSHVEDDISQFIRANSEHQVVLPALLARAREQLADLELDVLFYQDIGLDPLTHALAFARLAPVQCVSFGHPNTTGIPNIDYFVSSEGFETADSPQQYSESLFLLKDIPTLAYYYRPRLATGSKSRADFGLAEDAHIYLCPQSLFKFHPDFDDMLARILRADAAGEVVLLEGRVPYRMRLLADRFRRVIPDVAARIRFLPTQIEEDFLALVASSDVMLDTPHFNGMNTTLEAFAVGTPVVTLPQAFQRGRHTLGMYKAMEILDCVARDPADYAMIAVRLGTDRALRASVSARILAANHVLYENSQVVREFERFFLWATARAQANE